MAAGLVTLGTDERAVGQIWHLPGPETVTTRALLGLIAEQVNHQVKMRIVPKNGLRVLGLVSPMMRELAEMSYEFEQPFILDTSKYESTFTTKTTPLSTAIRDTIAWYQAQRGAD
jgi:nucleoside-diphosphate-sugar epimerase